MRRLLAVVALGVCAISHLDAQTTPQSGDDLVGLWGSETTFGPQVRGELTLERAHGIWTMRIAGFEAMSTVTGDSLSLALPGDQGKLRARIEDGGRVVRGHWIQPAGNLSPYATPISLELARADAWRGVVIPLDDRFSMYLFIRRQQDGALKGSFHNPEVRWNGRAAWFRVTSDSEGVKLWDPATGRNRFTQPYDSAQRRITMDFGALFALTPRTRDQAVGFLPRVVGHGGPTYKYEYRVPLPATDGWITASAADVALDPARLTAMVQRIIDTDATGDSAPLIHSIVVARRGKLVLEEYFFGYSADRPHALRSASKTFTSVMAGVAMDRGYSISMETPVYSLFPADSVAADPRKARITLGQLLTHSSGLACDDNAENSPGNEDKMQQESTDWYRYTLDLPMAHDPGTLYAYCSGGMNLAGGAIARTTGAWLPEFFERFVARPLGIERYHMNLMPDGQGYSGGGVHMRPRDLLKFGQLYLNGGTWNGQRVVSESWVRRSTAHQIDAGNGGSDGYGWHRNTLKIGGRDYQEYEANGNGGQFLIVVPELELAVVFTAGNYGQYRIWRRLREEWVGEYLIPET